MSVNKLQNQKASKEKLQAANANRIDQIINVTEKYERTERHLEKDLSITSPEAKEHEREIQKARKSEIENLKNIIAYGENEK